MWISKKKKLSLKTQKKHSCENCPTRNSDVFLVSFGGKKLLLCAFCRKIARDLEAKPVVTGIVNQI